MDELPWVTPWRSKRRADPPFAKTAKGRPGRADGLLTSVWYREMRTLLCMGTFANPHNGPSGEANDAFGNNAA